MNERISRVLDNPISIPSIVGVVAFGAGLGIGYILGRRNKLQFHEIPQPLKFNSEDIEKFIAAYKATEEEVVVEKVEVVEKDEKEEPPKRVPVPHKMDEYVRLRPKILAPRKKEPISEKLHEIMQNKDYIPIDEKTRLTPIYPPPESGWDYEAEVRNRSNLTPHIIHRDEFFSDELGYTQSTFTYYAGDDIMADEDESPVYNYDTIIGPLVFGHGSDDPNVFYVRNDKRKAEYEICFDEGLYSVEILGLQIENNERVKEVKHSARKFKME